MPASHTSPGHPDRGASRQPASSRPNGTTFDAIEHEGISWEGDVHIVGQGGDIPARLFVTSERFVLTSRETVLLETPRAWLVPAPLRVQDNRIRISITPEGVMPGSATSERLMLTIASGRGPAAQLLAILTGRARQQQIDAEFANWKSGVGAGRASSLPPLPAFETVQDTTPPQRPDTADPETRGVAPIDAWKPDAPESDGEPARNPLRAPDPDPVEPQSRAARFLTTRPADPDRPVTGTGDDAPANVTALDHERRRRRAGWGIWSTRIALVLIAALVAGWFARPYLPDEVTDQLPALRDGDQDNDLAMQPGLDPVATTSAAEGDGTNGAGTDPKDIMPTAAALGVGGATSDIPEPEGATGIDEQLTGEPPADPDDSESDEPSDTTQDPPADNTGGGDDGEQETNPPSEANAPQELTETEVVEPTQAPVETETEVVKPTEIPVEETPTATETSTPTETPVEETPTPTETVTATETPIEETPTPTETVTATETPVQETPTPTETVTATETPVEETPTATETAEPTLEPQAPSVNPDEPPAQEFVQGGIRYSIDGATSGTSLAELPEIAEVSYGEWIVLAMDAQNQTGEEQIFDMREFSLLADGQPIQIDVGNSWVASMMGYTPAYGNTDAILWAPGEEHQFVLTFLAPTNAQSLVLQAGDQQLDLSAILTMTPSLGDMRQGNVPETIDATVVDVIDGETIVIEKDGVQQTVRYLGIDIPTGDDCYAAESTEANRTLVTGRAVKIERQATDVDARGNWVRDVWVEQDDGRFVLVAHQLVGDGAATAGISQPNTRFSSWLLSAEAMAQAEGRGLWGACGEAANSVTLTAAQSIDGARKTII